MKAIRYLFLMALMFSTEISIADDPGLPGGDPDVPVDGGMAFLIVAGVCYGIRKIRNKKENEAKSI